LFLNKANDKIIPAKNITLNIGNIILLLKCNNTKLIIVNVSIPTIVVIDSNIIVSGIFFRKFPNSINPNQLKNKNKDKINI